MCKSSELDGLYINRTQVFRSNLQKGCHISIYTIKGGVSVCPSVRLSVITSFSGSTEPIWLIFFLFDGKCCVGYGKNITNLPITSRDPVNIGGCNYVRREIRSEEKRLAPPSEPTA